MPHLVFDASWAAGYAKGGWEVTEVRQGVWQIVNPKTRARDAAEAAKVSGKGRGR